MDVVVVVFDVVVTCPENGEEGYECDVVQLRAR